ncbi:MAG TPA: hypothetical protein VFN71_13925 [Methylomirabilota bacterium]|nr:hypothetical protein [Methylomirabilota bacterium]
MIGTLLLGLSTAGFATCALLHLSTFTPLPPPADWPVFALAAGAWAPLIGMLVRLRRTGAPMTAWGRVHTYDWRQLAAPVPDGIRWLGFGMVAYVLMNLGLSLMLVGGTSASAENDRYFLASGSGPRREVAQEEYEAYRRVSVRLGSGHLLLFYLVPLIYFRFVDPGRAMLGRGAPPADGE